MAESGSELAPNFVPILWISQNCPNRGYSQYIGSWLIFGFLGNNLQLGVLKAITICSNSSSLISIFCNLLSRASNRRRIVLNFSPHAQFTALDFETRNGTMFDLFFCYTDYCPGHCDLVLGAIIIGVKFALV